MMEEEPCGLSQEGVWLFKVVRTCCTSSSSLLIAYFEMITIGDV